MDIEKLNEVVDEILECKECSFWEELEKKDILYRPDVPLGYTEEHKKCKVISVGINPRFDCNFYNSCKEVYREPDLERFKKRFVKIWENAKKEKKIGRQPYRDSLYTTFKIINDELKIYDGSIKIDKKDLFDYIFWSNLTFCSSNSVSERIFDGVELPCKVYEEEIPNCLNKGYLKRIIEAIEPKLIMFFGADLEKRVDLKKNFDISGSNAIMDSYRKSVPVHKKGNTTVETTIIAYKLSTGEKDMSLLFLPHPNYWFRFNSDCKAKALKDVCDWLKKEARAVF